MSLASAPWEAPTAETARGLLPGTALPTPPATDLTDAARKVVALAAGRAV